jgi:hypothetical protein
MAAKTLGLAGACSLVFVAVRWFGDRKRTAAGAKRDRKRTAAVRGCSGNVDADDARSNVRPTKCLPGPSATTSNLTCGMIEGNTTAKW